ALEHAGVPEAVELVAGPAVARHRQALLSGQDIVPARAAPRQPGRSIGPQARSASDGTGLGPVAPAPGLWGPTPPTCGSGSCAAPPSPPCAARGCAASCC